MWVKCSHKLQPLNRLTSKNVKFKLADIKQKVFDDIKLIVKHNTLFVYPVFNKKFGTYVDASDFQSGPVIIQGGRGILFYSRKLTETHTRYTLMEKELLRIIETMKDFVLYY